MSDQTQAREDAVLALHAKNQAAGVTDEYVAEVASSVRDQRDARVKATAAAKRDRER